MPDNLLAKHLIRASREYAKDFNEELMQRHKEAMVVCSHEELIALLTNAAELLSEAVNTFVERFLQNDPTAPDYNTRRKFVHDLSDLSTQVSEHLVPTARGHIEKGYDLAGLDDLIRAFENLDRAVVVLKKTCPEPNKDMLERTARNIRLGEVKTVKEILHGDDRSGRDSRRVG